MDLVDDLRRDLPELRETHVSSVLLGDREVLKLKKHVDLGFLDFRTLAARERACHDEVELNARLAPGVYLGVVPIVRGRDGSHRVGEGDRDERGEIVDWAVRMLRLPDEQRADMMLARGALSGACVDAVADRLARFHADARSDEGVRRFGEREVVAANVRENFAQTEGAIAGIVTAEEIAEVQRKQLAFLERHAALFDARVRAARIRDGHGDLRLEHAYFRPDGSLVVIDCIEFNERFRFADVCADIAFFSMDLAAHGRSDLAERFVARYARASNDFDLYALVDFYEAYRAYVRAKIAVLRADRAEARKHLLLALATGRASLLKPALVAVGGVIASGKSTLAERLGAMMSAPVVDADRTRKHMLGVEATAPVAHDAWSGAYDPQFTERVYEEVMRRASVVLASGRPVVVDASFRSAAMRAAARDVAHAHRAPFRFIECTVSRETALARLAERARGESVSDGRAAIYDDFCARYEPPRELRDAERLRVDTSAAPDESAAIARRFVDTWPDGLVA
jgi:aminoglycoside phosphotransferase family enzyme/predicted kinase